MNKQKEKETKRIVGAKYGERNEKLYNQLVGSTQNVVE